MKIQALTDFSEFTEDGDSQVGRNLVRDFHREYDQGGAQALDYKTWLPFAAKTYNISKDIGDYVLSVTPICPADIPNRNGIGFPLQELKRFAPPPSNRMVYKCWAGCPTHKEHDNEDITRAFGVVLDSSLHKVRKYGGGEIWKVMGLVATDKRKNPDMAQRVLHKKIDTYSMGATADYFSCSLCGTPIEYKGDKVIHCCDHIDPNDEFIVFHEFEDTHGQVHVVYKNAHNLQPFELSIVEDPAWPIALGDTLLRL